jgi:hypothetical protein
MCLPVPNLINETRRTLAAMFPASIVGHCLSFCYLRRLNDTPSSEASNVDTTRLTESK